MAFCLNCFLGDEGACPRNLLGLPFSTMRLQSSRQCRSSFLVIYRQWKHASWYLTTAGTPTCSHPEHMPQTSACSLQESSADHRHQGNPQSQSRLLTLSWPSAIAQVKDINTDSGVGRDISMLSCGTQLTGTFLTQRIKRQTSGGMSELDE